MILTHFLAFIAPAGGGPPPIVPMQDAGGGAYVLKSPGSQLDWPISWALESGETITGSTWSVSPTEAGGLAVVAGSASITGAITACLVAGGVFRRTYQLTNTITTSAGRVHQAAIAFRIGTPPAGRGI